MRIFLVLQRICSDLFFKGVFQLREERFCNFFSDCNLIDVDADLTAVAQLQECNFTCGILQVRVGTDDAPVPGFSAKLKCNRRQMGCRFRQHMGSYFWRAGVEDFVKSRVKQEVGDLMPSFSNAYIFRRKDCAEHFFEHGCAGRCFGTGLNHSRVSSCKAGSENTQREKNRKIVRADQQCCAIGHFIDLREETRETGQATEMGFRPGPSPQIPDSFIDLNKSRTDIAEIGFRITPSEICYQRSFQL